jgi:hypothetical protein
MGAALAYQERSCSRCRRCLCFLNASRQGKDERELVVVLFVKLKLAAALSLKVPQTWLLKPDLQEKLKLRPSLLKI